MVRRNGGFIGTDGLDAPDPPTGVAASGVATSLSVSFTAPTDTGTSAITGFRAQASGVGTSGTSSPLTITGLTEGTSYNVSVWAINAYGYSAPSDAVSASPAAPRGVFAGGYADNSSNVIDYIQIATDGNATDFGDLTRTTAFYPGSTSSSTRGVFSGGFNGGSTHTNIIDYITIASTGDATDFGDLSVASKFGHAHASTTRGVITLGRTASSSLNTIEYITIANTGNTTDFGNLSAAKDHGASCASPTRGVIVLGEATNTIEYITIASTGNTTDFGNLTQNTDNGAGGVSSETRGVFFLNPDTSTQIQYVTIASTGNATDFGDVSAASASGMTGAVSSSTKGVTQVGAGAGLAGKLEKITIATTGNGATFGDLTTARYAVGGCSNDHGGLQ